ncbi:MAG: DMT family transporter [Paracoccaceae bacterium]
MTAQVEYLTGARHNVTGILLMIASMALFAMEDALLKLGSSDLPTGQMVLVNCAFGTVFFGLMAQVRGEKPFARAVWTGLPLMRSLTEVVNTILYVTALALIPLSMTAAMLQATPIIITAAAAIFFGEKVGWRRWTAISIGFLGVMIILRPGAEGFRPAAILALVSAVTLAMRELFTRRIPTSLGTMQLGFAANACLTVLGVVMMQVQGGWITPSLGQWGILTGIILCATVGYTMVIGAARMGEVAVVTPFRYVRLPFAMIIALFLFAEVPDTATLIGSALVIGTGLYTLARERMVARQRKNRAVPR